MAEGAWGIDISRSSIKCVRLEKNKDRVELTDVEVVHYPLETAEAADLGQQIKDALKEFTSRNKVQESRIVCSLPSHSVFNRFVKLPPVEDEKVQEIVQYEARAQIPFPFEEVFWDYQLIDKPYRVGEEKEVILFAIKKDIVNQFLSSVTEVGLTVDIIQFAPVALANFLMHDQRFAESYVVLDVGANNADLIVIDGTRLWIRNLPITGNDFTKGLQKAFDISFAKAEELKIKTDISPQATKVTAILQPVFKDFVGEVYRSLGFYKSMFKQAKFEKVLLLGNGAKMVQFRRYVPQAIGLQLVQLSQLDTIALGGGIDTKTFEQYLPSLGTATGLALQGIEEAKNRVNLLPTTYTKQQIIRKKKPLLIAATVLLYLFGIGFYLLTKSDIERLQSDLRKATATLDINELNKRAATDKSAIEKQEHYLEQIVAMMPDRSIATDIFNLINQQVQNYINAPDENDRIWISEAHFEIQFARSHEAERAVLELEQAVKELKPKDVLDEKLAERIRQALKSLSTWEKELDKTAEEVKPNQPLDDKTVKALKDMVHGFGALRENDPLKERSLKVDLYCILTNRDYDLGAKELEQKIALPIALHYDLSKGDGKQSGEYTTPLALQDKKFKKGNTEFIVYQITFVVPLVKK